MPGLNGKGPQSEGPMSGRGLGNCRPAGNDKNQNDQLRKVDPNNLEPAANQSDDQVVYGRGQGGQPRGGGGQGLGRGRGGGGRGRGSKQ
ncbi:MAG: DUF5320 domain-containing protein [Deltaproteobacteria bacterium]|nr:DUF5320 domain-containing protein [Deltaproteobacteria bacterium]